MINLRTDVVDLYTSRTNSSVLNSAVTVRTLRNEKNLQVRVELLEEAISSRV